MLVEAVACSVEDARIAQSCGAGRIELCSAIELGGLTPSLGVVQAVLDAVGIPVVVMIRPRAGGFVYSESELGSMRRDIELLDEEPVAGFVLGVLAEDGSVDAEACAPLMRGIDKEFI